jgi:hypothetical protein
MGLLAVGVLAGWVYWRRQPRSQLKITDTAITWGSPTKVVTRLERGESGLLRFHQNAMQQTGWFLTLVDDREAGGISMIGFDMREVADACVAHGWRFR